MIAVLSATAPDVSEARKHYEAGRALYSVDRFREAAAEFEAGFALAPRPLFLFNVAQSLRRLAEVTQDRGVMLQAQVRYREYLGIAPAQEPEREQTLAKLTGIDQWLKDSPVADAPIAVKTEAVAPAPREVPLVVAGVPEAKPAATVSALPWVIVGIGVAVAGAAVGTYFGVRASQGGCGVATIGCLDARR